MHDYKDLVRRLNAFSAEHEMHGGITAEAADAIEELSKPKRISAEERLPKEWWPVLALIRFSEEPPMQEVLWHIGNSKWRACWDGKMLESKVSHWMLLPSTEGLNET